MKNNYLKSLALFILIFPLIIKAQTFTNINAGLTGLHFSDVAWGDYDADGDLDVIIAGLDTENIGVTKLYKNEGDDSFVEVALPIAGTYIGDIAWGDYDDDGDLDILIQGYTAAGQITSLYENRGDDVFVESEISLPALTDGSVSFVDFNNDGFTDFFIDGLTAESGQISRIYKNTGNGTFTEIDPLIPATTKACYEWGDYDKDGDLDLFLTGFASNGDLISKLYQNNGDETFTLTSNIFTGAWLGDAAWGDYNNDGYLDMLLSGYSVSGDRVAQVYKNNGDGSFNLLISSGLTGVSHSSTIWGDYDNDGDLDVFIGGTYEGDGSWVRVTDVFINNGNDTFTAAELNFSADVFWGESAWGDYDADGDLDLICCGYDNAGGSNTFIYKNNSAVSNTIPDSPENLSSTVTQSDVNLSWSAASDNETPANGLSYNVYIKNENNEIQWNSLADINTGMRFVPALGNAQQNTTWEIGNLPNGDYSWSVQAIDNNFAGSNFADEGTFTIDVAQAIISVYPEVLDFGDVEIGTYETVSIAIENTGTLNLEISQIQGSENFMLSYTEDGTYDISLGEATVTPDELLFVFVRFYSVYTQFYDEIITINSNDTYNSEEQIQVTANCVFIGVESLNNQNAEIFNYPNLTGDKTTFYFNFDTSKSSKLKIYNVNGMLINTYSITNRTELILATDKLNKGLYFYKIENENNNFSGKFIKN